MNIRISSHESAKSFLSSYPNLWDVIVVTNQGTTIPEAIQKYSKCFLHLIFDDVDCDLGTYVVPRKKDVEDALVFSEGKENLLVTCHGGISRSSALAYAARCKSSGNPKEAILILTPVKHYPNKLIVKHASEILEDRLVFDTYMDWLQRPVKYHI